MGRALDWESGNHSQRSGSSALPTRVPPYKIHQGICNFTGLFSFHKFLALSLLPDFKTWSS